MILVLVKCLIIFLIILTTAVLIYFKWIYQFWKRKKFPYLKPSIPYGNIPKPIGQLNPGIKLKNMYEIAVNKNFKYVGVFVLHMPRLIVTCPKLMENILHTDFSYFTDRGFYFNERDDPLSANLFAIGGEKWRIIRNKLSACFTLGKIKAMIPILKKCVCDLNNYVYAKCTNNEVIDIKDFAMSYNINVIAECGFGIECDCFVQNNEFKKQAKKIFDLTSTLRLIKVAFAFTCTKVARSLGVTLFDGDTTKFFTKILKETINFRRENNIIRHDMINSIIELGTHLNDDEIKELAAQVFIFFVAGYETTSITLTFCIYELSLNSDVQEKLRQEINQVLKNYNGDVTYEALKNMKYMDQVISETLRKYPPAMYITRVCVRDYPIPNTSDTIPKGTDLDFSILGLHYDKKYFSDPHKFDPERFSKDNKHRINPLTYIPFGAGPRKCIGMQLGLVNVKLALTMLLHNYSFTLNERTRQPIEYDFNSFTLIPKHEILLNAKIISNNIAN